MAIALAMVTLLGAACSAADDPGNGSSQSGAGSGAGSGSSGVGPGATSSGSGGSGPGSTASTGAGDILTGGDLVGSSGAGDMSSGSSTAAGEACATETSQAGLEQVYLAFAFDVSASMGSDARPYWDRTLKWDPVVAATKEFFSNTASTGLTASLTFFPSAGQERQRCSSETYTTPNVPMTALPSAAFSEAIDAVTPMVPTRMSTPTLFVTEGTIAFIEAQRQQTPGKYVIVLVTDGYPEYCGAAADSIDAVLPPVEAARANGIATYVIGVANPPVEDAPDTVSNLNAIAVAGGSERAFLIDTGDPAQTANAFKVAIDQIRSNAVSCTIPIPAPPPGRTFDKQKVNVKYTSGTSSTTTNLTYDQECAVAGAWRYNDPANPTSIVLCEDSCTVVQADFEVSLGVDFTCEDVIKVPL